MIDNFPHQKMKITTLVLLDVIVWEIGLVLVISIMSGWIF